MVVKSATKKRLMDLGIPEDVAHVVADDRKIDDVRSLSLSGLMDLPIYGGWALQIYTRIRFQEAIIEHFRKDPVSGAPRLVAYANPLSSLDYILEYSSVINRIGTKKHDYDLVRSLYLSKVNVLKVDPNLWRLVSTDDSWARTYYEDWVQRNSLREVTQRHQDYYDTGVLGK